MTSSEPLLIRFAAALASVNTLSTLRERLCESGRLVLDADGAVVTSETVPDGRTTLCWTHPLSRRLETLQDSLGEGPLIDSLRDGSVVLGHFGRPDADPVPGGAAPDERWPRLRGRLAELGFTGALIAVPLRSELDLKGVLLVHRDGPARHADAIDARFLGAAIGTAVLQDPELGAQGHVFAEVLADRDVVHRASETLMAEASVPYEDALAVLRAIAFSRGEDLGPVARAVLAGHVTLAPSVAPIAPTPPVAPVPSAVAPVTRPSPDRG